MKGIVILKTHKVELGGKVYTILDIDTLEKRDLTEWEVKKAMVTKQLELLNYKFINGLLTYTQGDESIITDHLEENFAFILYRMRSIINGLDSRGGFYDVYYESNDIAYRCKISAFALEKSKLRIMNAQLTQDEQGATQLIAMGDTFEETDYITLLKGTGYSSNYASLEKPRTKSTVIVKSEADLLEEYRIKIEKELCSRDITELLDNINLEKLGIEDFNTVDRLKRSKFDESIKRVIASGAALNQANSLSGAENNISLNHGTLEEIKLETECFGDMFISNIYVKGNVAGTLGGRQLEAVTTIELIDKHFRVIGKAIEKIQSYKTRYWEILDTAGNIVYKLDASNTSISKIRYRVRNNNNSELFTISKEKYKKTEQDEAVIIIKDGKEIANICGDFEKLSVAIKLKEPSMLNIGNIGLLVVCYIKLLRRDWNIK